MTLTDSALRVAERLQCLLVEQDAEDGFSGDGFLQPYFTTVLLGDVLGQGKSQAYSVFLAGAYERLEECFPDGVGYAWSRVTNTDFNLVIVFAQVLPPLWARRSLSWRIDKH